DGVGGLSPPRDRAAVGGRDRDVGASLHRGPDGPPPARRPREDTGRGARALWFRRRLGGALRSGARVISPAEKPPRSRCIQRGGLGGERQRALAGLRARRLAAPLPAKDAPLCARRPPRLRCGGRQRLRALSFAPAPGARGALVRRAPRDLARAPA